MFEIEFTARLGGIAVRDKALKATVNLDLRTGLFDQLLDFLHKDGLRFRRKEDGLTFLAETAGCEVMRDRTVNLPIQIMRTPGLIDKLLDLPDGQDIDFLVEVDHVQPPLVPDGTEDDAGPATGAITQAMAEDPA